MNFSDLMKENKDLLHSIVWKFQSHPHFSMYYDDLKQEAMIALWRAYELFDPSKGVKFQTYAYRSILNQCIMLMKRKAERKNGDLYEVSLDQTHYFDAEDDEVSLINTIGYDEDKHENMDRQNLMNKCQNLFAELDEEERFVVFKLYGIGCEKKPPSELCEEMNVSVKQINVLRYRGLRKLKSAVKGISLEEFLEAS